MTEQVDSCVLQVQKPQIIPKPTIRFSIRPATEEDIPGIKAIRQDLGIHDVPTVFQTFMKMDPECIKIAITDTGKILGCGSTVLNGDDNDSVHAGGLYCVVPKFRGTGIANLIYKQCIDYLGDYNCAVNAVPAMTAVYRDKGGFPIQEKDWLCLKNQTPNNVTTEGLSDTLPPGVEMLPFQDSFLPEMVAYDQDLVGFRRSLLLSLSCNEKDSKTLVAFKNGKCVGFGTIKKSCLGAGRVGPLYADDPMVAEAMLKKLLDSFPDRDGFAMFTLSNNVHANSLIKRLNCPVKEACDRLYKKKRLVVDYSKVFALFDMNFAVY